MHFVTHILPHYAINLSFTFPWYESFSFCVISRQTAYLTPLHIITFTFCPTKKQGAAIW